jgi:Tol biopolymer transport system component
MTAPILGTLSCGGEDIANQVTDAHLPAKAESKSKIVFSSNRGVGLFDIYVMNADGTGLTRLTNSSDPSNLYPVWSPNGRRILFLACDTGDPFLHVMNADGSNETRLTNAWTCDDDQEIPDWSPDGRQIAYVGNNSFLRVINADGTGSRRVTNSDSGDEESPAWAPDGRRIAFVRGVNVHVINPDGSQSHQLTNEPSFTTPMPAWSPDGRKIAFVSHRDGNFEIYTMNADGSRQTRLTNALDACPVQSFHCGDWQPTWSPSGRKIAFTSDRDGNDEIYVMDADGTGQTRLTNHAGSDVKPRWSRDGSKLFFTSNRDGNLEIYVMNADGTGQSNLTRNAAHDIDPNPSSRRR